MLQILNQEMNTLQLESGINNMQLTDKEIEQMMADYD
jgi:hypothetical protein